MSNELFFRKRIDYKGKLSTLLKQVASDYKLGTYQSYEVVERGYEDFNVVLKTTGGKFFVKFFANFRSDVDCKRYVDIMLAVLKGGIKHPKLFKFGKNNYLYERGTSNGHVRLVVMEYINGRTFFELKRKPSQTERDTIIEQAALINNMKIRPAFVYDDWAVTSFLKEYSQVKRYLDPKDIELIEPLAKQFSSIRVKDLPHCFVHGDIIDTNVMLANSGEIYILDFSVSNIYPRIQELALMFCNIFFEENEEIFHRTYAKVLEVYQKKIKLESYEIAILPLYIQAAHAMHIIGATKFGKERGMFDENRYWLEMGRRGLKFTRKYWRNLY